MGMDCKEADRLLDQFEFQKAETLLESLLLREPDSPVVWSRLAAAKRGLYGIKKQVETLEKALNRGITSLEIHFSLGVGYAIMDKQDTAIQEFRKALLFDPDNPEIYNEMGLSLQKKENYKAADDCFCYALKLDSNYADAFNNQGVNAFLTKNYLEAESLFQETLKIDPEHENALINLRDTAEINGNIILMQRIDKKLQEKGKF